MKLLRFIGHPITIIILFLLILISGKAIGSVYLFYILLALPEGHSHALLAVCGILLLLVRLGDSEKLMLTNSILNTLAIIALFLSLYLFFTNDTQQYNYVSFRTGAFWITFGLFCLSAMFFLINTFLNQKKKK